MCKDDILELIRTRVLEYDGNKVQRVILYGSRAMGIASEESDYDVPMDIWAIGETEFEETKEVIGGLAFPANKYGIVLT